MRVLKGLLWWPVDSQLGARRNALVASTALAQQRMERAEVDAYVERCRRRRAARNASAGAGAAAAR